jgi:cytochrome c-type biogenesis protein CcmF
MTPIGLVLLFLTGVGPLIAWRKASAENLRDQFTWPAVATVVPIAVLALFRGMRASSALFSDKVQVPLALVCFGFCAFVFATIGQEFYRATRIRQGHTKLDFFTSLIGLVARGKRRYGGYLVHLAIVLMFIGFAGSAYKQESEATLERGQTVKLDRYTVRYDGLERSEDSQKTVVAANLTVLVGGREFGRMKPAKWVYKGHEEEPTTEVEIRRMGKEDLFLVLNGYDGEAGIANLKVVINPLVNWIWIGFLLLALGTVIAYLPDRAYAIAAKEAKEHKSAAQAVSMLLVLLLSGGAFAQGMEGARTGDLHTARNDHERAIFKKLKCLCSCAHGLDECGSECGPGVPRRLEIQQQLDAGKSEDEIMGFQLAKYGQEVFRLPLDRGFNRLAWGLPMGGLLLAAGSLVMMARRMSRRSQAKTARPAPVPVDADDEYQHKLDDELDGID